MKQWNSLAIFLLAALAAAMAFLIFRTSSQQTTNPFESNAASSKEKSRSSDSFAELEPIKLDSTKYKCIAAGSDAKIYVAGEKMLTVFSPEGKILKTSSIEIDAETIHAADDGKIYIGAGNKVFVLDQDLKTSGQIGSFPDDSIITSIATNDKNIFVADAGTKKVWRFDAKGNPAGEITGVHEGDKVGFVLPSPYFPVAVAPADGALWAANPGNHKIAKFADDGKLISEWGTYSADPEGFCGCCNPIHFAIAKDGSFVTAEKAIARIKTYDPSGKLLSVVAGPENFDEDFGTIGMALDPNGRIIVLDRARDQIRIFVKKK